MKKVTYLLAAFALATSATMTSCVDNNESAAVEQIRTAKAKQLEALASMQKALGDADIIRANAEMVIAQAEAELKKARAAVQMAEAELKKTENEKNKVALEEAKLQLALKQAESKLQIEKAVAKLEKEIIETQEALETAIRAYKEFQDGEINKYLESLFTLYSAAIKEYQAKSMDIVDAKKKLFEATTSQSDVIIGYEIDTPAVGNPGEAGYVPATYKPIKNTGLDFLKATKEREIRTENKEIAKNEAALATLKSLSQQSVEETRVDLAEMKGLEKVATETANEATKAAKIILVAVGENAEIHQQDIYNTEMQNLYSVGVKVYRKNFNGTNAPLWDFITYNQVVTQRTSISSDGYARLGVAPYETSKPVELTTVTGKVITYKNTTLDEYGEHIIDNRRVFTVDQLQLNYATDQASLFIVDKEAEIIALSKKYTDDVAEEDKAKVALVKAASTAGAEYGKYLDADKALKDARTALTVAQNEETAAITANGLVQASATATPEQKAASAAKVVAANAKTVLATTTVTTANTVLTAQIEKLKAVGSNGELATAQANFINAANGVTWTAYILNEANVELATAKADKAKIDMYITLSTKPEYKAAYEAKYATTLEFADKWNNANAAADLATTNQAIYNKRVEVLQNYVDNVMNIEAEIKICEDAIAKSKADIADMGNINTMEAFIEHLNQNIAALEVEVVALKAKADTFKVKIDAEMATKK